MLSRRLADCPEGASPSEPLLETIIRTYNLCLLGFGNVNRTLLGLLRKKEAELRARGIAWRVTGVASRRMGWIADAGGLDVGELVEGSGESPKRRERVSAAHEWLTASKRLAQRTALPFRLTIDRSVVSYKSSNARNENSAQHPSCHDLQP